MFNGLLNHSDLNYHTYYTTYAPLHNVGIASYTMNSLRGYFEDNVVTIYNLFHEPIYNATATQTRSLLSRIEQDYKKLIGDVSPGDMAGLPCIFEFKEDTLSYEYTTDFLPPGQSLKQFVTAYDKVFHSSAGAVTQEDKDLMKAVAKVHNSLSGCISFQPSITLGGSSSSTGPEISLVLKNKKNNNNSNSRIITIKGSPVITDIPRRSTGAKYGFRETDRSQIGEYNTVSEGSIQNPKNTVTAPLKLIYNPSLSLWEGGTQQILARLLTDIDAPDIQDATAETLENMTITGAYDSESTQYISQFTVGVAMPMSVEKGNPYMFGPNFKESDTIKEKIRVVNRAPRDFKTGDVVMCSCIDGEWIVQGFDLGKPRKPTAKINKWTYSKMFVNSDSFFRDNRFLTLGDKLLDDGTPARMKYANKISPDYYEQNRRNKYYMDMFPNADPPSKLMAEADNGRQFSEMTNISAIAMLNLKPFLDAASALGSALPVFDDFEPSNSYIQVTIFDHLGPHMGGNSPLGTLIGRTNANYPQFQRLDDMQPRDYGSDLPFFWGPTFPDGYSSAHVQAFKTRAQGTDIEQLPLGGSHITAGESDALSLDPNKNLLIDPFPLMFADSRDGNLKQLPAEVATNGSPNGKFSYPISDWNRLFSFEGAYKNLVDQYANFMADGYRLYRAVYEKLSDPPAAEGQSKPKYDFYALDPVNPAIIQFSPLQAELALHSANPPAVAAYLDGSPWRHIRPDAEGTSLWGKALQRNTYVDFSQGVAWGPLTLSPSDSPLGLSFWPDSSDLKPKTNLYGIIAAKNKMTVKNGGSINFTTKQSFGQDKSFLFAGAGGFNISIVLANAASFAMISNSSGGNDRAIKQWGSYADNYNSVGTTTLHLRVFDGWPEEDTLYDPRYFSILHFNPRATPSTLGFSVASKNVVGVPYEGEWTDRTTKKLQVLNYPRDIDISSSKVDFRVPTVGHPTDTSLDNTVVPLGATINIKGYNNEALRPQEEWAINPVRRGQLLTAGGFRYYKRTIGIQSYTIESGGTGYIVNNLITLIKGAILKVTGVSGAGAITSVSISDRGKDFISIDFGSGANAVVSTDGLGTNAIIFLTNGIVYDLEQKDEAPKDRLPGIRRLTIGSNAGDSATNGQLTTNVSPEENANGLYDAFYYFKNDTSHTLMDTHGNMMNWLQYVTLELSVG